VAKARKAAEDVAEEAAVWVAAVWAVVVVAEDTAVVAEAAGVVTLAAQVQPITAYSLNQKIFGRSFIWQNSGDVWMCRCADRWNPYQFIRTFKIRISAHHPYSTTLTFKKLGLVFEV
jgi:hypothetical protein